MRRKEKERIGKRTKSKSSLHLLGIESVTTVTPPTALQTLIPMKKYLLHFIHPVVL
jgi:hypothetical protein